MLHHTKSSHLRQHLAQFGDCQAVVFKQSIKEDPSTSIGKSSKHIVHSCDYVTTRSPMSSHNRPPVDTEVACNQFGTKQ